jgi:hypothetical protein
MSDPDTLPPNACEVGQTPVPDSEVIGMLKSDRHLRDLYQHTDEVTVRRLGSEADLTRKFSGYTGEKIPVATSLGRMQNYCLVDAVDAMSRALGIPLDKPIELPEGQTLPPVQDKFRTYEPTGQEIVDQYDRTNRASRYDLLKKRVGQRVAEILEKQPELASFAGNVQDKETGLVFPQDSIRVLRILDQHTQNPEAKLQELVKDANVGNVAGLVHNVYEAGAIDTDDLSDVTEGLQILAGTKRRKGK